VRRLLIAFVLLVVPAAARASERLELWTMGRTDALFERFGHAAICIGTGGADGLEGTCWNYGAADFSAPGRLVWQFLRQRAPFWAAAVPMRLTYTAYSRRDRAIYRQVIPLSPEQLARVKARLARDLEPAHRFYIYDHLNDNCSTRVRDIVDAALGGGLAATRSARHPETLRSMVRDGFSSSPLLLVGAALLVGRRVDRHPTVWEAMFHPDVLRAEVEQRLGAAPEVLYARRGPLTGGRRGLAPFLLGGVGALLAALIVALRLARPRAPSPAALALLVPAGLGLLIGAVVFVARQPELRHNELLFVLLPLDLAFGLLSVHWQRRYLQGRLTLLAAAVALSIAGVLSQPLLGPAALVFLPLAAATWPPRRRVR
jgi:hypothetical protein